MIYETHNLKSCSIDLETHSVIPSKHFASAPPDLWCRPTGGILTPSLVLNTWTTKHVELYSVNGFRQWGFVGWKDDVVKTELKSLFRVGCDRERGRERDVVRENKIGEIWGRLIWKAAATIKSSSWLSPLIYRARRLWTRPSTPDARRTPLPTFAYT